MGKRDLTRRQFMATIAAGAGTVLIGNAILAEGFADPLACVPIADHAVDAIRLEQR